MCVFCFLKKKMISYDHTAQGLVMRASIAVVPDARFCSVSEDLGICYGVREDSDGAPLGCLCWKSGSIRSLTQLPMSLTSSRAK